MYPIGRMRRRGSQSTRGPPAAAFAAEMRSASRAPSFLQHVHEGPVEVQMKDGAQGSELRQPAEVARVTAQIRIPALALTAYYIRVTLARASAERARAPATKRDFSGHFPSVGIDSNRAPNYSMFFEIIFDLVSSVEYVETHRNNMGPPNTSRPMQVASQASRLFTRRTARRSTFSTYTRPATGGDPPV